MFLDHSDEFWNLEGLKSTFLMLTELPFFVGLVAKAHHSPVCVFIYLVYILDNAACSCVEVTGLIVRAQLAYLCLQLVFSRKKLEVYLLRIFPGCDFE